MLAAWVELAAVPAALTSVTIASYMLSACVWLAKYILYTKLVLSGIFYLSYGLSTHEHQNWRAID